jgi:hypothetical protein
VTRLLDWPTSEAGRNEPARSTWTSFQVSSVPKERERLAFWALVFVAGERAANVLVARRVIPDEHGIKVEEGVRKVRGSSTFTYLYEWSTRSPARVSRRNTPARKERAGNERDSPRSFAPLWS